MWKNIVESGSSQMTTQRKRVACWIPTATNTYRVCKTYCFPTTKMVARTHLNVKYIVCLVYKRENVDGRTTCKVTA